MRRSTYLLVATLQTSVAFAPPPQLLRPQAAPHLSMDGAHDVHTDSAIGCSDVLSRVRSRKTALNSFPESSSYNLNPSDGTEIRDIISASGGVGDYNKEEKLGLERETAVVGDPQTQTMEPVNITDVLTELQAIQSQGPKKYCILGTRHCSFLHQQIVEML